MRNWRQYLVPNLSILDGLIPKDFEDQGITILNTLYEDVDQPGTFVRLTVTPEEAFEFKEVTLPKGWKPPLSVALDPSSTSSIEIFRGNSRYVVIKPMAVAAINDVEAVSNKINNLSKFVVLASDQIFDAIDDNSKKILVNHIYLQGGLSNTLKHLKEAVMTLDCLKEVINILKEYEYKYSPKNPSTSVIIMKDGPLLSNGEYKITSVVGLNTEEISPTIREYIELYQLIKSAAKMGIPVVGITKDAQQQLLASLCGISWSDYGIVKAKAGNTVKYAYLSPIEKFWSNSELKIHYYYIFVEKQFSCLRVETLGNVKLKGVKSWVPVIEDIIRMIMITPEVLEQNGQVYKLPLAHIRADQIARDMADNRKNEALAKAQEILHKCPYGSKVRLGLHITK